MASTLYPPVHPGEVLMEDFIEGFSITLKRPGFRSESQQGESEHAQEVQSRAA